MRAVQFGCCHPRSFHGAARLHWVHANDCLLLPGREIEPKSAHPAGTARDENDDVLLPWQQHPQGCLCRDCVYAELNYDRDDDTSDVEGIA